MITTSIGNESNKLHNDIMETTNKLVYKDIVYKPHGKWTPVNEMSIRNHDMTLSTRKRDTTPISARKEERIWWPARRRLKRRLPTQPFGSFKNNPKQVEVVNNNIPNEESSDNT